MSAFSQRIQSLLSEVITAAKSAAANNPILSLFVNEADTVLADPAVEAEIEQTVHAIVAKHLAAKRAAPAGALSVSAATATAPLAATASPATAATAGVPAATAPAVAIPAATISP